MALKPVMRQNSIPDLETLVSLIEIDAEPKLTSECVEAMINNETCFFRDQANFALLTGPMLDAFREQRSATKRLRIWSAACSTGQEPYSLAMDFAENPEKWRGWQVHIHGDRCVEDRRLLKARNRANIRSSKSSADCPSC